MDSKKEPIIRFAVFFDSIVVLSLALYYKSSHVHELNGPATELFHPILSERL
jgi:hypothetical protein